MALDAATLALIARELREELVDCRIDKIFQPTRDEVVFQMRSRAGAKKLFLSARSGSARACLTTESFENPAVPPSFCMLMRKHLGGGRLISVREVPAERILFFDFACTNEMGDPVTVTVASELMGRYSNLVLIDAGEKIIDALKRIDADASALRQLLPGLRYTLPPKQGKPWFFSFGEKEMAELVISQNRPVSDALMRAFSGIGPVVCREVSFRAFGGEDPLADALSPQGQEALCRALKEVRGCYEAPQPTAVFNAEGSPVEFSFFALTQYGEEHLRTYQTFSALMDAYYNTKDRQERLRQKSKNLAKQTASLYERAVRKQAARKEELASSEDSERLKLYGELLSAHLYALQKGAKSAVVQNYYTGEEIEIPLDVRIGPAANVQKYFKEYKKKQTAKKVLARLLEEGELEIEYLATVQYEVEHAEGENALSEIRQELKSAGYLKHYKQRDKRQKPADFLRYRSSDGFLILVGRNNLQNDRLTLKVARGKDLWFHLKNAPGSHTVVISEGRDIPLATQNEAAMIALYNSSAAKTPKAPVDYTRVRNIRKTGDLKPGMVLYESYETAYVTVDAALVESLAEKG